MLPESPVYNAVTCKLYMSLHLAFSVEHRLWQTDGQKRQTMIAYAVHKSCHKCFT